MCTVRELYEWGSEELEQSQIENAAFEARILLEWILDYTHAELILEALRKIEPEKEEAYKNAIKKRKTHYPLQYIMKSAAFMDFEFYVDEAVLIPRQDTEILVETILQEEKNPESILDLCTGSGCIAISLKKYFAGSKVSAADISVKALEIARKNAKSLDADISLIESDLFEAIEGRFEIIVSNPPYIETDEIEKLMAEVKYFEPRIALDGKKDGLFFYERILGDARKYLKGGGRCYFEIGCGQAGEVKNLFLKYGYRNVKIRKDLAGLDRVIYAIVE